MFKKIIGVVIVLSVLFLSGCTTSLTPAQIQSGITTIANNPPQPATIGVAVQSMQDGSILYAQNFYKPFLPASNLKLFTAAAALVYLGPNYVYNTAIYTENGDVYIKFTGDPDLTTSDVVDLFSQLKQAGITTISGNIYIDDSQFDGEDVAPGWAWDDLPYCYGAPIDAIMINHNCLIPDDAAVEDAAPAVQNPYVFSCKVIQKVMNDEGIHHHGKILPGIVDNNARLIASHTSPPLTTLVTQMLKNSDNQIANSLLKTLGANFYRQPGDWNNGVQAMQTILNQHYNIDFTNARIVDGSGLSRYDLVTPAQTLQLLTSVYQDKSISGYFINALPVAGVDGTLKHRMYDSSAVGHVHAKTGTMSGVSSLSGYAYGPHHHVYAFVVFTNNFVGPSRSMTIVEDTIANLLTT